MSELHIIETFIDGIKVDQWFSDDNGEELDDLTKEQEEELGEKAKWIERQSLPISK